MAEIPHFALPFSFAPGGHAREMAGAVEADVPVRLVAEVTPIPPAD